MNRFVLYASLAIILAIGGWFYARGEEVPAGVHPILAFLLAIMSFAYARKAQEDGDWGAGNRKIRENTNPRAFRLGLCFNYAIAVSFLAWGAYLLLA